MRTTIRIDDELYRQVTQRAATLWSADRGFARFPDLRWHHPLD